MDSCMQTDALKHNLIYQRFLNTTLYVSFILLAKMVPVLKIQSLLQQLCRSETNIVWNSLINQNERLVSVPCTKLKQFPAIISFGYRYGPYFADKNKITGEFSNFQILYVSIFK